MVRVIGLVLTVLAMMVVGALPGQAGVVDGPYLDLKTVLEPPPPSSEKGIIITVHWPRDTYYYDKQINRIIQDHVNFHVEVEIDLSSVMPPRPVIGLAYTEWSDASRTGMARITTIYGSDPNPLSPDSLSIVGFGADDGIYADDERLIGASGTEYLAHTALVPTVGELAGLLPGYDLSPFGGDPDARVYLFQTDMPFADMAVPLPGAVWMAGAMGGVALAYRRMRRG